MPAEMAIESPGVSNVGAGDAVDGQVLPRSEGQTSSESAAVCDALRIVCPSRSFPSPDAAFEAA